MYPRQSPTTHTEELGDEASVYDWARAQVHALNPTAARVWRQCDGATSPRTIAGTLRREMGIREADAVVDLTLRQLARVHLLELPGEWRGDRPATTRRWLLARGLAAATLPAVYSIMAPSPVEALSGRDAPTLTSVSPNQGTRGTTVAVTLTGTNFVVGATTVEVAGGGMTVNSVIVGSTTSLTANFVLDLASIGARTVTVTTAGGTSGGQTFTINLPASGSTSFAYTGSPESFTVPAGVISMVIEAVGAAGGPGTPPFGTAGKGGRAVANVSVTPGTVITVRVGGQGQAGADGSTAAGGFNGGGGSTGDGGGGGGGATSVYDGATPLVIAGGGGGGGRVLADGIGSGGHGGDLTAQSGVGSAGGGGGGGGQQVVGGVGGGAGVGGTATAGTAGAAGIGGTGGSNTPGLLGGGGGGGGYFGGGGGGGGAPGSGGGGGGSSFTAPGATGVLHQQGSGFGSSVLVFW